MTRLVKPFRVLIFETHGSSCRNLLRFVENKGWECYVALSSHLDSPEIKSRIFEVAEELYVIGPRFGKSRGKPRLGRKIVDFVREAFQALSVVRSVKPDLILIGQISPGHLLLPLSRRVPKVYFLYSLINGRSHRWLGWAYGLVARFFHYAIVVNSQEALHRLKRFWNIDIHSGIVFVMPLATPVESYSFIENPPTQPYEILQVGGLNEFKGALDFVFAARLVLEKPDLQNVRFRLIGDGPLREVITQSIETWGIKDQFLLEHDLSHMAVRDRYLGTYLYVQSSHEDNFPLAVLDAMEMSIPCIVTRTGGLQEQVEDGVSGLVVRSGNPEELAAAIEVLLRNREMRTSMGREAILRYKTFFSHECFDQGLSRLINQQVKTSRASQLS